MNPQSRYMGALVQPSTIAPVYPPPIFPGAGIVAPLPPGFVFDDRLPCRRRDSDSDSSDDEESSISVNIIPQTVAAGTTATVFLGSAVSGGRIRVSGNSIIVRRRGNYLVTCNISTSRSSTSTTGTVFFTLNGGVFNGGNIAGGTLPSGESQVFSGSATVELSRNGSLSLIVNNSGGPVEITGGSFSLSRI